MEEEPGKLKYINGIPYLTGRHVKIDTTPPTRMERWLGKWQGWFGPRWGGVLLVLLLVTVVAMVGAAIDYVIVSMLK